MAVAKRGIDMGTSRRTVLGGASALGAAGLLAACGTKEPAQAPTTAPGGPSGVASPSGTSSPPANAVPAAQVPAGGGRVFPDRRAVVTQPAAGQFKAFDPTCPHQGCLVTDVSNGLITCPCHLSQFRITDGSVARGPNDGAPLTRGLTPLPVTVQGDWVVLG